MKCLVFLFIYLFIHSFLIVRSTLDVYVNLFDFNFGHSLLECKDSTKKPRKGKEWAGLQFFKFP